jgi:hypothetical protein
VPKAGCLRLDGREALAWVRTRHLKYLNPATGRLEEDQRADISRIERQQAFMRRLIGLAVERSLANPLTANEIVGHVVDNLKVDSGFDKRNIFDLIEAFRSVNPDDTSALEFTTFPWKDGPVQQGQSVLYPDTALAKGVTARLADFGEAPPAPEVSPADVALRVLNGSGRTGIAKATLDALTQLGFQGVGVGDDARGRVAETEVRFADGAQDKARLVLDRVGSSAKLVGDPTIKGADVVVVLGADFDHLVVAAQPAPAAAPADSAPAGAPPAAAEPADAAACQ